MANESTGILAQSFNLIAQGQLLQSQAILAQNQAILSILSPSPPTNGPTAVLDKNQFISPQLVYPENIGSNVAEGHLYPHAVKFYINVPNVTSSAVYQQALGNQGTIGGVNPGITGLLVSGAPSVVPTSNFSSVGTYASNQQANQTRVAGTVTLYMPDTVTESYEANYDDINLGDFKLKRLGQMALTTLGKIGSKNSLDWTDIGLLAAGQTKLGEYYPAAAVAQSDGVALNPNVQLLFRSISLRQFQFEFMFSPKNSNESVAVQNIIRMFKFHAAPEVLGSFANGPSNGNLNSAEFTAAGLAFVVPSSFNIQFLFLNSAGQWVKNSNLYTIGNCVLESIAVDYAPNGWSTFTDGNPTQIRMTLQFKETTIVTKSEVSLGF